MSNFENFHPALQHHIVNSLGWRELRPFQDAVIPHSLAGEHLIVLAPTAGGKTEAAFFPVLSRMLSEGWLGLSVLYLCPIKALLNNLDQRLQRYSTLLGRRAALWHGDVKTTARQRILRDPPDCLLTTPESLEVMLVSPKVDARTLFSGLRVVIVDEIHAFAGDDRGWHLLSVLERISHLAGREVQRIGLSATVGNPDLLVDWLAGSCKAPRRVLLPPPGPAPTSDVKLDFVGSLQNAAVVINRLHRGEKRLVFVDSRARAEQLGLALRQAGTTTFVTHSSLSQDQRHQAEEAFANRDDCVIVATSVLELGVDVGDLDRVIQLDSPSTVSSFLQRMGRTGRRAGTTRNCLFLATSEDALLQAAGLMDLWASGYVEPVVPPPDPYHVLAQQLMALVLQEGGIGRRTWLEWVAGVPGFAAMPPDQITGIVQHMLDQDLLWDEEGLLGIGRAGEKAYGRRHFMELMSVFLSPPLFRVLHGREELGQVDAQTFLGKQEGPRVLLLGGRPWRVTHVDWSQHVAWVEASDGRGKSSWRGEGRGLGFRLCQAMQRVLATSESRPDWSQRAAERIELLRDKFAWLTAEGTVLVRDEDGEIVWWTYAGIGANATLAPTLSELAKCRVVPSSFALTFDGAMTLADAEQAVAELRTLDPQTLWPTVDEAAEKELKFADCLPPGIARQILAGRLRDLDGMHRSLSAVIRHCAMAPEDRGLVSDN